MKKCLILGGGFAGLSSAVYLSKAGIKVELIEASPKLGGRAYSLTDTETGSVIDNGQHILMGCYKETLKFFDLINATGNLEFQKNLKVNFVKKGFELVPLKADTYYYPLNLLAGILNYKALSFSESLRLISFFIRLSFIPEKDLKGLSVYDWLEKETQTENIRKAFWEILCVGALNTNIRKASAITFANILKKLFLRGNKSANIILPKHGLSESYCDNSQKFIEGNGGNVFCSEKIEELIFNSDKLIKVITSKREISYFDFVISTMPLYSLEKVVNDISILTKLQLTYSSILSIHIWLNKNKLEKTFYGLINSKVHWVFNHGTHLTLVISDANGIIELTKEELFEIAVEELNKYLNISRKEIRNYKVLKEKRATYVPSNDIIGDRPFTITEFTNFLLAGDWVETGLPSTIESAVFSGRIAAEIIISNQGRN
jgi:squalene-associated FAD-dependent desaturase